MRDPRQGRGQRWALLLFGLGMAACNEPRAVFASLSVTPDKLAFSTLSPSPPVQKIVEITNTGEVTLTLAVKMAVADDITLPSFDLLTTDCHGLPRSESPLQLGPGECARATVVYTPTVPESITNDVVITASNEPEVPAVRVPVTAVNRWPPPVCPVPPVADIQADANGLPLAAGASTTPATVTFSGAGSSAGPEADASA